MPNEQDADEESEGNEKDCPSCPVKCEGKLKQSPRADDKECGSKENQQAASKVNDISSPSRGGEAVEDFG